MGKAKVVNYYNDRYCGDMTPDQCDMLEQIIQLDRENGVFSDLKHVILNIDDSEVTNFIEDHEMFGGSMHPFNKKVGTLRDEQTLGVAFMFSANRCILGDSVGMGKTVQTAGAYNLIRDTRAQYGKKTRYLVLTQKNLAAQFRTEMVKFTGEFVQLIPSGEEKIINQFIQYNPYQYDLDYSVVGTHGLLSTKAFIMWLEQCRIMGNGFPFDILIVDESSCLGGKGKQMIDGYKSIAKYFKNIYFLNATPFETNLEIFYNQLNLLDGTFLPTKQNFTKEYCLMDYRGMYPRPTGKYKNQEQFKKLVAYRYFARTRRDKGATMEDCDGRIIISPLSQIQKHLLQKSMLHRIVYDCPSHIDPTIEFNTTNVPKLASLQELLENECSEADSIIIFVQYKEAQKHLSNWLSERGHSNKILNGDTCNEDRQTIIKGFKYNEFEVLITNVQRGLNFGSCNYCIFYSFDPNPSHMVQFEGRITRDFDIIGKHIYVLCSSGPELKNLKEVVMPRAKATTEFTNSDLSVIMNILLSGGE